jgi:SAM-dependent methyltransferase
MTNREWDGLYAGTSWGRYPSEDLVRFVARNLYKAPDRRAVAVLEVGCGPGPNVWYLAREGFHATGLDTSAVAIDQARTFLQRDGLTAQLDVGDVTRLPYGDAMFHAVLDNECLSALTSGQLRQAIDEIARVLKPGGWFYSKTLGQGTTGENTGDPVDGEPGTRRNISSPVLRRRFGVHRFAAEHELPALLQPLQIVEYDSVTSTRENRAGTVRQWLITARRPE